MHKLEITSTGKTLELDGLLLDNDGTLVDGTRRFLWQVNKSILEDHGFGSPSEEAISGLAKAEIRERVIACVEELQGREQALRAADSWESMQAAFSEACYRLLAESTDSPFQSFPDAQRFLVQASLASLPMGIVTNASRRFFQETEARVTYPKEVHVGWNFTAKDVAMPKPAPDLLLAAVMTMDLERPLMIGDSMADLQAALAASMPVIIIKRGASLWEEPEQKIWLNKPGVFVVDSLDELKIQGL